MYDLLENNASVLTHIGLDFKALLSKAFPHIYAPIYESMGVYDVMKRKKIRIGVATTCYMYCSVKYCRVK